MPHKILKLGVIYMSELKKILVSIPDTLLQEVDLLVTDEKKNRSELIRDAMRLYIDYKRKRTMKDMMKKGYQEMAEINLKLAEMCFELDNEEQGKYEEKLAECE
jgi:CopG family transcriptional regulator/antitoxin EndoAI